VAGCRNDHDRAIAIQISGLSKAHVGPAIERVLLKYCIHASGVRGRPAALVNEAVLRRCHQHGHAGEIRHAADMVPMRMGQKNVTQLPPIVPCGIELVGGCLKPHQVRSQAKQERELSHLLRNGSAKTPVDQEVALRMPHKRGRRHGVAFVPRRATAVRESGSAMMVRIVLSANGNAEVACATSDIATGTYTIMAQVAADMLGLPLDNISMRLGDSTLPQSPVEGGSWIATTAEASRNELLHRARQTPNSPLAGAAPGDVGIADGKLVSRRDTSRAVAIADAMRHGAVERIEREMTTNPAEDASCAHNAHSAVFAEVKVDEQIGVIRVTRIASAVAAGRILNTKTASSQILGGMVWGIGMALHEER
jgi:CO/xanthine dehydrogenase Mo-binding subunit